MRLFIFWSDQFCGFSLYQWGCYLIRAIIDLVELFNFHKTSIQKSYGCYWQSPFRLAIRHWCHPVRTRLNSVKVWRGQEEIWSVFFVASHSFTASFASEIHLRSPQKKSRGKSVNRPIMKSDCRRVRTKSRLPGAVQLLFQKRQFFVYCNLFWDVELVWLHES